MNTIHRFLIPHSSFLIQGKCLLAFSHGLDSTALYHLLAESGIDFDIALVNYGIREQADVEEAAARELAERDGRRIFVAYASRWESDFEAQARKFRYDFFESLIEERGYENLLTAHQLNDRLEWMLMRLLRGAGTVELAGMEAVSERQTLRGKSYRLIRPLLETPRHELEDYLRERKLSWFYDVSNESDTFERNRLRPFLEMLIREHSPGIRRTFEYLKQDTKLLSENYEEIYAEGKLRIYRIHDRRIVPLAASKALKELGYLLGGMERKMLQEKKSIVAGRKWAIELSGEYLYLAPYVTEAPMTKSFKEACRLRNIPMKIRPWLYRSGIDPGTLPIP
ncbi:tRNA lysidine(34) synthetase TilS [Nitratifractor sp.]|uniref:tRNA lysidine(34) synthetase TilS n=1 Tax=Nitratifractor sp. TaxID=2268144 RepID=UPI0025EB6940|nr:tRNA lysidine(34) synthetase TilS [Nitratifractor sp.]